MPRGPRADARGAIHHVMIRGVARARIFCDAVDRENFLLRLDRLIPELGFRCFAWALMANHVHLAIRTGPVPLPRLMARLETGYALYFNRRHGRCGHLLQNRYKSRLVEDETDLLGLLLYIHRNPLEAGLVARPGELGRYPWCGHGALTGERRPRPFEATSASLRLLADDPRDARRKLHAWMAAPETADQITALPPSPDSSEPANESAPWEHSISELIGIVAEAHGLAPLALGPPFRSRRVAQARADLAQRAVRELGFSSRAVARALGVSDATVSRALHRKPPA